MAASNISLIAGVDLLDAGYWFYIWLDTKQVILEMLFLANLLTSTEKTKSKPGE